ncbi:MAG: XRE family transcriptional regulator [Hyphomicrobiales bacterium]|nr:MAG: XRE family transcriptional regulator [Hyphomicrobiales bacterium]
MERKFDIKIAKRLKALRAEHELSLDQLAQKSGISRATLSRLENAEVSPTAAALGKLAAVYKITMSQLMAWVEAEFAPLITNQDQQLWQDPETGFTRRMISPPAAALQAEMLECFLPKAQSIIYPHTPKQGLEHHIYMLNGALTLTVDDKKYNLEQGDSLRYQLFGASEFATSAKKSAKYILTII